MSGPFHLTATLHSAPLLYRRGKLTPFYPLLKVPTQSDTPQKYFKDQRCQCGDPSEKNLPAPPSTLPQSIDMIFCGGGGGGWCRGYQVKWPHTTKMFAKSLFPQAGLFLVIKHKFKLPQFEFMRLVISKKSLQSSRSTLFASQMFPNDRLFVLLTTSWENSTRSGRWQQVIKLVNNVSFLPLNRKKRQISHLCG